MGNKQDLDSDTIREAIREHSRRGHPEKGAQLKKLWGDGSDPQEIPSELLDFTGIKSEKATTGLLEMPPRTGRGSGKEAWAEFAAEVSDLDPVVLEKMNRDEIVDILESRRIIPLAGEEAPESGAYGEEKGSGS